MSTAAGVGCPSKLSRTLSCGRKPPLGLSLSSYAGFSPNFLPSYTETAGLEFRCFRSGRGGCSVFQRLADGKPTFGAAPSVRSFVPGATRAQGKQSQSKDTGVLLLIPAGAAGGCRAAGPPLQPQIAPSPPRAVLVMENHARNSPSAGELLAHFAIRGTNLSEIYFRRKKKIYF